MTFVDVPGLGTTANPSKFVNDYKAAYGSESFNYPFFAAAAYDAVHLFADGIKSKGNNTDKVKDYLYSIKNYDGAAGTYHFDSNGDVVGIALTVKQLKNGEFVNIQ
jgi:ABC-type branched-subunit amino acid transport system substrate-binding protein